ncbi:hypothetical protein HJC23_007019 [Cyclotella cryptica]|uniref:Uncharacterized protein n=1 Tax=Cyclotella cryptica TaxID=29204 RepID=A0ABD3QMI5_9STRA|eukprot:CCRYP_004355-RA/>CCRYP_004355-RA protein AED:0.39 eAED:0.39 QI:311/1/1/1/1/1/2/236/222
MSLAAIAIISRQGNPIFIRDFDDANLLFNLYGQKSTLSEADNDFFCDSLIEETKEQRSEWQCCIKHQFALFSAYERLVQMLEGGWKGAGVGPDACWMGLVCSVDGFNAYGYVTTNARYITLVEDVFAPDDAQLQKARENELKTLLVSDDHTPYRDAFLLIQFTIVASLSASLPPKVPSSRAIYRSLAKSFLGPQFKNKFKSIQFWSSQLSKWFQFTAVECWE